MGTRVTHAGDQVSRAAGQTLWAAQADDRQAGMAWDWIELARGVVAMADPLSVITNMRLLGPHGDLLPALESMVRLNQIVHSLPWQDEVERTLYLADATA
jgi:hypothetical protein